MTTPKNPHIGSDFFEAFDAQEREQVELRVLKQSLSDQLRNRIKERGVSQAQLARETKTSLSTVRRLLDPKDVGLSLHVLVKIALGLRATVSFRVSPLVEDAPPLPAEPAKPELPLHAIPYEARRVVVRYDLGGPQVVAYRTRGGNVVVCFQDQWGPVRKQDDLKSRALWLSLNQDDTRTLQDGGPILERSMIQNADRIEVVTDGVVEVITPADYLHEENYGGCHDDGDSFTFKHAGDWERLDA